MLINHSPHRFTTNVWGLKTPNLIQNVDFVRTVENAGVNTVLQSIFQSPFYLNLVNSLKMQQQAQFDKSNNVQFSFSVKGVAAIDVAPNGWFNKTLVQQYASQIPQFFGTNGKFPLLPKTIYVAFQPRVEIIVDITTVEGIQSSLDANYVTWLVGGFHFSHTAKEAQALNDNIQSPLGDYISISPVYNSEEEEIEQLADFITDSVLSESDQIVSPNYCASGMPQIQLMYCIAQLRARAEAAQAAKIVQKYKIVMESRSEFPQILGVVNEILPAL